MIQPATLLACIDHTTLNATDHERGVADFCRQALQLTYGGAHVAAVCVYPPFVATAASILSGSGIRVASVAGAFPHGQTALQLKVDEVRFAVDQGADEVDIVISRGALLAGDHARVADELAAMRDACRGKVLKVIIESGELPTPDLVATATRLAIAAGADFVKTSTGKIAVGATLPAAETMLCVIADHAAATGRLVGFKAAGGIRQPDEAQAYAALAAALLGPAYIAPATFRIGASSLTQKLLTTTS